MLIRLRTLTLTLSTLLFIIISPASADEKLTKLPLNFYVFLHDDIPQAQRENIAMDYFSWLRKDLESFTHRRVYVNFVHNVAPLTEYAYQGGNLTNILSGWSDSVKDYADKNNLPINRRTKYLLLTNEKINGQTLGIAGQQHYAGIASLGSYPAAAHEIGHMLGGTHDHSEVLYKDGWWCETNIFPTRVGVRANCYHYSDKNKEAIAAYLSESP
jgi:hypothetical protein